MNYLTLVQRLKRESARSGSVPASLIGLAGDDLLLATWIADAWLEVQRKRINWDWMRKSVSGPLVIGQQGYTLAQLDVAAPALARWQAAGYDYWPAIYRAGVPAVPYRLIYLGYEQFRDEYIVRPDIQSQPTFWTIAPDKRILLSPRPDAVYTLKADYWAAPTALALDTDEPDMPEQHHLLLVWRALQELAGFDAAPEVDARANRNLRMAWADLHADQAPQMQLGYAPLF